MSYDTFLHIFDYVNACAQHPPKSTIEREVDESSEEKVLEADTVKICKSKLVRWKQWKQG